MGACVGRHLGRLAREPSPPPNEPPVDHRPKFDRTIGVKSPVKRRALLNLRLRSFLTYQLPETPHFP
jgi:hypothetical protein